MHIHPSITLVLSASFVVTACSSSSGTGTLSVDLTDDPGPYSHVYVTVQELSAHRSDGGGGGQGATPDNASAGNPSSGGPADSAWVTIPVPSTSIDLLTLQNGLTLPLGSESVPAGTYDMLRLVVGGASVVVGAQTYTLTVPSGSERGVQVSTTFTVQAGGETKLLLDFSANDSIVEDSSGGYILNPVLSVKQ